MSNALIAALLFLIVCPLSGFLVWRSIGIGNRLRIVNRAGTPSARIGGLGIAIAFWTGLAVSFALPIQRYSSEVERVALIGLAGAIVVVIMLVDDAIGLSPVAKLLVQLSVACVLVVPRLRGRPHGIVIDQFNAPLLGVVSIDMPIAIGLTILWLVAMMNAINWIDGIDGLAPTVTLVGSIVLFLHTFFWPRDDPQFTISVLPLVLGAALIGFLPFNWHPAKITLGDAGSNFLGLTIGAIAIVGGAKVATALLVMGLPLLDFLWVSFARAVRGRPVTIGDKSHLHHRLLRRGWSVGQIVAFVGSVSLGFGVLSLVLPNKESKLVALLALAGVLLVTVGRPDLGEAGSGSGSAIGEEARTSAGRSHHVE